MGDEILSGGHAFFAARRPCLQIVSQPPSPPPPSQREGGDHKLVLPGASPPAPRHLPAYGTYRPCRTGILRKGACGSAQWQRNQLPKECAARVQFWGCKGRSPLREKTFGSPPSRWEGGAGGWGQNSKLTERQARDKQSNPPQGFLYGRSAGVKEVNAAGVKFMPPDVAKKPRMWYTECGKPAPIYAREKEP